jgi:hypothetical protein
MPERKSFLLRIDPRVLQAVQRWADDDLRSLNSQIEFLLRRALMQANRQVPPDPDSRASDPGSGPSTDTAVRPDPDQPDS